MHNKLFFHNLKAFAILARLPFHWIRKCSSTFTALFWSCYRFVTRKKVLQIRCSIRFVNSTYSDSLVCHYTSVRLPTTFQLQYWGRSRVVNKAAGMQSNYKSLRYACSRRAAQTGRQTSKGHLGTWDYAVPFSQPPLKASQLRTVRTCRRYVMSKRESGDFTLAATRGSQM